MTATSGGRAPGREPFRPSGRQVVGAVIAIVLLVFIITNTDDARQCRNLATELRNRPEFDRSRLPELTTTDRFEDWALKESWPIARSVAYRNGSLPVGRTDADAPVLPPDYAAQTKAVGERRAILAGYRLAAVIREAVEAKPSASSPKP